MSKQPQVFLAHAKEDKDAVRQLHAQLLSRGFKPWLDEEDLLPGQNWRVEISKAIKNSNIFAACFSKNSVEKKGYVQREFRIALDECAERPPGSIFLIPVKLDDCEIPDLQIPQLNIALRDFHWVEIWKQGAFERLARAIEYDTGNPPAPVTWIKWNGQLPSGAILAGIDQTSGVNQGTLLYICRGRIGNGMHPGKLWEGKCNIGYGGYEIPLTDFEVAVGTGRWDRSGLAGALVGGNEDNNPLYVCRINDAIRGAHPGKLYKGHCNIGYGGKEIISADYELFYPTEMS